MALRDKLTTTNEQILSGKKALADALIQVGITAVEPNPNVPDKYETFQSYADKIKRLMISNSLILEYEIPDENLTKYQRTIFLPHYHQIPDQLIIDIVNSDTGYTPSNSISTHSTLDEQNDTIIDVYGNEVADGTKEPVLSELEEYLITNPHTDLFDDKPMPLATSQYSYTVDWGDGSEPCEFIDWETTPEAWYHTYEQPGTYDVTINGIYQYIYSYTNWYGAILLDGQTFYDKDGSICYRLENKATKYRLKKVIAWGNTQLHKTDYGFISSTSLESVPMYDTTNSFNEVVTVSHMFYSNSKLLNIPYDSNSERGLFSNCSKLNQVQLTFSGCYGFSGSIPPKVFSNCPITSMEGTFQNTNLTGDVPKLMFQGLSTLINCAAIFYDSNLSGSIPEGLFNDCVNLEKCDRMFMGTNVSGIIPSRFFKNTKLSNAKEMFYRTKIEAIDDDAFSESPTDIHGHLFLCRSGLKSFNTDLLHNWPFSWSAKFLALNTSLTGLTGTLDIVQSLSAVTEYHSEDFFGGCTGLTGTIPIPTISQYSDIEHILGMFSGCENLDNYDEIPAELGGNGNRLFHQYHVGQIYLSNGTFVEPKDYVYNENALPLAFCYKSDGTNNFCCGLNDLIYGITTSQANSGMTNTINVSTNNPTHITFDGEENMRIFVESEAYKASPESFPAVYYTTQYNSSVRNDLFWYIPDMGDLFLLASLEFTFNKALTAIIREGGGYTSSNCYVVSHIGVNYWTLKKYSVGYFYMYNDITMEWSHGGNFNAYRIRPIINVKNS